MHFQIQLLNNRDLAFYRNHTEYHPGDSGLDLYVVEDQIIPAHETRLVGLGVKCRLAGFQWCPWKWFTTGFTKYYSYYLFPRSSISKSPLRLANSIGLVDSTYVGELKMALHNTSDRPFEIKRGQRYVQLVRADLGPVNYTLVDKHDQTSRGESGFGSTGGTAGDGLLIV